MSSAKRRPFCLGLNVLIAIATMWIHIRLVYSIERQYNIWKLAFVLIMYESKWHHMNVYETLMMKLKKCTE